MTPRPVRTQWIRRDDEVKPEPISASMQKAKNLPMPGPSIVVSVPIHLWIEYQELYGLEPTDIQEPKVKPKDGPGEAILLVKRVEKK